MNRVDTLSSLAAAGLARLSGDIALVMRDSIRLTTRSADEAHIPVGSSKVGGLPDLAASQSWPSGKGSPLAFIAQINLAELQPFSSAEALPQAGMLSFFYDANQQTFGESPADGGGWQVFFDGGDPHQRQRTLAPDGLPATARYTPCTVAFSEEVTLPQEPGLFLPQLDWTSDERKRYEDFLGTYPTSEDRTTAHHRLLGHPDTLQDDMHLQCALMANGVASIDDPRAAALEKTALNWRLLFQVDSDENAGMKWSTSGMLYYWIERDALAGRDFSRTWLILQAE